MIQWTEDSLWQKTRLLVSRAKQNARESPLYAFWSTLALEMLARSVLAAVNPCLLADIRGDDRTVENLLYACGIEIGLERPPISIAAKTVFSRCERLVPQLIPFKSTREDLLRRRNEDVHSGGPGFQNIEIKQWIADYYQMCSLLLGFRSLSLADMFGAEEARLADKAIAEQKKEEKKAVLDLLSKVRNAWEALPKAEKDARTSAPMPATLRLQANSYAIRTDCPICMGKGALTGIRSVVGPTRLDGISLTRDITYLPELFSCIVCQLRIRGYQELRAAGFAAEFTVEENLDPVDFHEIDIDEYVDHSSYNEAEYGND